METDFVYLKTNVVPEPLFLNWYAWPHLISPATAAMNIAGRHLKIMNSYIQAPHIHAAAVKNPKMLGGPFMDYDGNRAEEVKKLKEETLVKQAQMLDFAKAVVELSQMLKNEADGHSLEPLYEKVPDLLKGYVELVYDINNQAGFRFIEALLYKSQYYDPSVQSIAFYLIEEDERPFVLSTPRLSERDNVLHLEIPFQHEGIDELFKMQRQAGSYRRIRELLNIAPDQEKVFRTFFTTEAPQKYRKYEGDGIHTRYFGHACILTETKDVSILLDPVISYGYNAELSRYTYTDLPDVIDYVIITHNHQDHILFETLLQLRHKIRHIIVPRNGGKGLEDPSVKLMFNAMGFDNVIELDELESLSLPGCKITGVPFLGEHSDLNIRTKLGYHVVLQEQSILFAADSCNIEPRLYQYVHNLLGDVDIIFLGMECDGAPLSWLYGPLLPEKLPQHKDQSRRLAGSNYVRADALVRQFNPKELFIYAMGQEPWLNYIMSLKYTDDSNPIMASNRLIRETRQTGINAERLFGEKDIVYERQAEPA